MPIPDIMTIPEIWAAREGLAGLGADDFGGDTGSDWDYNGGSGSPFGFDSAGNTIVNPGGYAPPPVITPGGQSVNPNAINWNGIVQAGFSLTRQIIQTQPGVYTQQGPNGTITYHQPVGQTGNLPIVAGGTLPIGASITGALSGSNMGIIALGGAALLLLLMMGRR